MAEENELKVLRTPKVYETVDEVLEANAKWKAERVQEYKDKLIFLKKSLEEISSMYMDVTSKEGITKEEIRELDNKITNLKSKIIKFEQMIADYESKPW